MEEKISENTQPIETMTNFEEGIGQKESLFSYESASKILSGLLARIEEKAGLGLPPGEREKLDILRNGTGAALAVIDAFMLSKQPVKR